MAYVTSDDLIARFGTVELIQLTDRTNKPATTIDAAVVGDACDDASAYVDTFLAARYQMPLTSVPPILARMTADIARYYLWGTKAEAGGPIERAYLQASAWLGNVAKGVVKLELVTAEIAPQSAGAAAQFVGSDRPVFTRDFRGY